MKRILHPLQHLNLPWLLAVALVTTLPHSRYQPFWLIALVGLVLTTVAWQWWRGYRVAQPLLKVLLVVAGCAGIFLHYRTLLGRDTGVAMLVLFMALKLLELNSRRDAIVVINLGYFLLLTHYFYSQNIPTGLWLLASMLVVTAALIHLHSDASQSVKATLRLAGRLLLQSLPLMVALYLLFPRINGPLWGLPQDAHAGRTGLSSSMRPGSLADLAQSGEIAFRAQFVGPQPRQELLYWRGPVLDQYDGHEWQARAAKRQPPQVEPLGNPISYTLTLEAHNQRWLLPLDIPIKLPQIPSIEASMDSNALLQAKSPLRSRTRVEFTSSPTYRLASNESLAVLQANLQLPAGRNPRTRELAQTWQQSNPDPEHLVRQALKHFRNENFVYTLRPPLLGEEAMDEFLFASRRGFCEHYASAFVTLMRAAGVPARVVTGYQGGEVNPVDGMLVVRQSDAHAWAEVWLQGKGWQRVDPTAAISPSRIESGITSALPAGEPLPGLIATRLDWLKSMRNQWEAVNNRWNQWVLGYNPERQRDFLSRLGLHEPDWRSMVITLMISLSTLLLILAAWTFRPRREKDAALAIWQRAIRRLERRGINCPPWESPLALAQRLGQEAPELAPAVSLLAKLVSAARYQPQPPKMEALHVALRQLP